MTTRFDSKTLRRVAAISALALAGGLAGSALASPHGGGGMPMMGRGFERLIDSVDASADQRAQIDRIRQAVRDELMAERQSGATLHEQAMNLFAQPTVDAQAAEALRQQMLARHDRSSQRMMQAMIEVSQVLTPEQRQQMAQKMQQRGKGMKRHSHERRAPEPRTP